MLKHILILLTSALVSLFSIAAGATPLVLPRIAPFGANETTLKLPGISPLKIGPVKLAPQFVKRPRVDSQKTIKDVGVGLKFSIPI